MRIKLALLMEDENYLSRLTSAFSAKYAEHFEIYSFTEQGAALAAVDSARIDILIAGDTFEIPVKALPPRCGFAYFVDSADVEMVNGQRAICRFQKVDLIYKQILSIYSEKAGAVSGLKLGDHACTVLAFSSPCGGTGTSSMAAACALYFAARGKKPIYLNLESLGSADDFFAAEGRFDLSDVIFAIKSKKANLSMKLESCVKQDPRGVCFYSPAKIALDRLELDGEDLLRLLTELRISGTYTHLILDLDFGLDEGTLKLLRQAHSVVWVADGSQVANTKLRRAYTALSALEQISDDPVGKRLHLIYNKFSNKTGQTAAGVDIPCAGGAPRYEHAATAQVLERLGAMEIFEKLM